MLQHEYSLAGAPSCWWHLSRFQIKLIYLHQKSTLLCLCASLVPFSTGHNYQKEQKIPSLPVTSPWCLSRTHLTILNTWWLRQFSYKKRKHIFLTTLEMCLMFPVSKQPRSASLADRPEVPPSHLERHRSSSSLLCAYRKVNHSFANSYNWCYGSVLPFWSTALCSHYRVLHMDGLPGIPLWPRQCCHCVL